MQTPIIDYFSFTLTKAHFFYIYRMPPSARNLFVVRGISTGGGPRRAGPGKLSAQGARRPAGRAGAWAAVEGGGRGRRGGGWAGGAEGGGGPAARRGRALFGARPFAVAGWAGEREGACALVARAPRRAAWSLACARGAAASFRLRAWQLCAARFARKAGKRELKPGGAKGPKLFARAGGQVGAGRARRATLRRGREGGRARTALWRLPLR